MTEKYHQNDEVAELVYKSKYLQEGETFEEGMIRIANALKDNQEHFKKFRDILLERRFLPGGRIQASVGASRVITPYNCYVSGTIHDSMESICQRLTESLQTMRLGGGIGYDFSTLRPSGAFIRSLDSSSCGPVGDSHRDRGFMDLFDAGCSVISSAGHRRGAQMGVLRVDHPDIRHFIRAKRQPGRLLNFNISVAVTDEFIKAVETDSSFDLRFNGKSWATVSARNLWDEIMRSTWDYAEPGVLFIDTINKKNNLWYCETIAATNPCGEQPLPPFGACLLGSFNLTAYIKVGRSGPSNYYYFDFEQFKHDIPYVVRAMDNIIDRAIYPLPEQEREAKKKRRMGLGVTGLANTASAVAGPYGSQEMLEFTEEVLTTLRDGAYLSSIELALEKGAFQYLDRDLYLMSGFMKTMAEYIREEIRRNGIRNSHLLSIAPTGTISLAAGNVSSGIEPPYTRGVYERNVYMPDGSRQSFKMLDYGEAVLGVASRTSDDVSLDDHVKVLEICSRLVDSSVSKTCNVGPEVTFDEFKDIYMKAYKGGASGITTFRPAEYGGKREGIMKKGEGAACYIDDQGNRTCD